MARREASLLPQRYVNEHPVKKFLGNFKRRQILLVDKLIFSLRLTRQPVLPATFPLALVESANICWDPRPIEIHWSLSMGLKELWVKSCACGMRLGVCALAACAELPVSDELLNNVFISGQGREEGWGC